MLILVVSAILLSTSTDVVQGKYLYHSPSHGWIKQHKVIATWENALQQCRSEGAVLASPLSEDLLFAMQFFMNNTSYFIGANARFSSDVFMSVEGVPLDNMPVADMYETLDPVEGKCLSMDREKIRVVPCTSRLPYFCYKKNEDISKTECGTFDKGYKLDESTGSCYKYVYEKLTWVQAYATCIAEGGYLAIVNNTHEANIIKANITDTSHYMLIGLRDWIGGGSWMSIHGDPVHKLHNVWEDGNHPNNTCCDCGMLHPRTVELKEISCDVTSHFICEKDPNNIQFNFDDPPINGF